MLSRSVTAASHLSFGSVEGRASVQSSERHDVSAPSLVASPTSRKARLGGDGVGTAWDSPVSTVLSRLMASSNTLTDILAALASTQWDQLPHGMSRCLEGRVESLWWEAATGQPC